MKKRKERVDYGFSVLMRQGMQAAILVLSILVIIVVIIGNMTKLNQVLKHSTGTYVQDVSRQLTNDIASRMEADMNTLQLLADSVTKIKGGESSDKDVMKFLKGKKQLLDFDNIVILDKEGNTIPKNFTIDGDGDLSGIQDSFQGKTGLVYTENQNLLFSAPIFTDDQVERVLIGIRKKENVQALIQPKSFNGQGLACIIDGNAQVIISPTNLKPFNELDDVFYNGENKETEKDILEMKNNLAQQKCGVFTFRAVDGRELVLAYHPMGMANWVLLMMVPADLISADANFYVGKIFVVTGGVFVLLILTLILIFKFYNHYQKYLEQVAYTDPMTGGLNNTAFQLKYNKTVPCAAPSSYCVAMMNIKGFKLINETFGIHTGDRVLKTIYQVLAANITKEEIAARGESDHFFLCLKENSEEKIVQRLSSLVEKINILNEKIMRQNTGETYVLSFAQGIFIIDDPAIEVTISQDRARAAFQNLRLAGRSGCAFYDSSLTEQMKREQELDSMFETSLKNHDFQVYLQPKVRLKDNKLGGAEALVRWIHPQKGMIYPSDFIPLFEKNGKIGRLDLYMFEEVCRLINRWEKEGQPLIPISVNLSRHHFQNPGFLKSFSDIAEKYQLPPGIVELELTESIFFNDKQISFTSRSIHKMHSEGFLCSIDDFGSGYSSLGMLKSFDVDAIKLDRRFFENISDVKTQNIIACIIELAEKLGAKTVAEGIETEEQLDYLRSVNCEMVQGYIFSKPVSIEEFEQWKQDYI